MKIVLAEDDVMLADCLAESLRDDGHIICGVAGTVAEAVALVRLHQPDVAILDMQLHRNERGSQIANELETTGHLAKTAILYVTGSAEQAIKEDSFGHGCLNKPHSNAVLIRSLDIVCDILRDGRTDRKLPSGFRLLRPARPAAA